MLRRRTLKILCFIFTLLVSIVCVFSSFSVLALSSFDVSYSLNFDKPEGIKTWFCPNLNSNNAQFNSTNVVAQLSFPSTFKFAGTSSGYVPNSTSSFNLPFLIMGLTYEDNLEFSVGYVYNFQFEIRYDPNVSGKDMSNFLSSGFYMMFPKSNVWASAYNTFTGTDDVINSLFYKFIPSSYSVGNGFVLVNFNIPIYPETAFPESIIDEDSDGNKYINFRGICFGARGSWLNQLGSVNASGTEFVVSFRLRPLRSDTVVTVFTPEEWQTHIEVQGFNDISRAISDSTDAILSGDSLQPSNIASIISQHEVVEDIEIGLLTTYPYQSVAFTGFMNSFDIDDFAVGLNHVSNWYDYVYNNCEVIFVLVWLYLGLAITVLSFRIIF